MIQHTLFGEIHPFICDYEATVDGRRTRHGGGGGGGGGRARVGPSVLHCMSACQSVSQPVRLRQLVSE